MSNAEKSVILYTTNWCGYCRRALALLDERNIAYENIDLTDDSAELARQKQQWKHSTVPIVIINGTLLGGCSDLQELDARTQLADLPKQS